MNSASRSPLTRSRYLLPLAVLSAAAVAPAAYAADGPVKVFVLAGQSNMEGKAQVELMERQLDDPGRRELYAGLRDGDGWKVRGDVWIKFLDRKGDLTVGFGSPGRVGPELGFGQVVGDRYDEQVLLIKTAWGGKSLFRDFRPPSAGLPEEPVLDADLEQARRRNPDATAEEVRESYGAFYRAMVDEVRAVVADPGAHFPGYAGQGVELAGLVWFQGWNDMINEEFTAAYTGNLAHFIRDARRDLGAPSLPVVVGVLGVDGPDDRSDLRPNPKRAAFKAAQAAVGDIAGFRGNVAVVPTDVYWDMEADAVFRKGWREHLDEWNQVGSDRPYHYLGSPKTMLGIGEAFGRAAVELGDGSASGATASTGAAAGGRPAAEAAEQPRRAWPSARFEPVELEVEGWTVHAEPSLVNAGQGSEGAAAIAMLRNHLQRIALLVPEPQLGTLRTLEIWIEEHHPELGAMQYHPSRDWLVRHGHDPRLAKKVHVTRASQLLSRPQLLKHPAVILHELAHAYHDQVLGFDEPEIRAAYEAAKAAGTYEDVLLYTGETVRHYGLSDHKEYFAEGTEAYFYRNDFFPFVRAELERHDPTLHGVLEKVWGPAGAD